MAQPFKDIRIFYDGLGHTAVTWVLDSRFDDPFPHIFELQFANNRAAFDSNEYEVLAQGDKATQLVDFVFRNAAVSTAAYYRIKLTTPAGEYLSAIKGLEGNVAVGSVNLLRELLRKEELVLRKDRGGVQGYLFKLRYYGPKCSCRDKNSGTLVSTACLQCAGTGFVDGYFPGMPFPVLIENQEDREVKSTAIGVLTSRQLAVRCLADPIAETQDLWMEADTSRVYEIQGCTIASRLSFQPVAVKLQLQELSLADSVALIISSAKASPCTIIAAAAPGALGRPATQIPTGYSLGKAGLLTNSDNPFTDT